MKDKLPGFYTGSVNIYTNHEEVMLREGSN